MVTLCCLQVVCDLYDRERFTYAEWVTVFRQTRRLSGHNNIGLAVHYTMNSRKQQQWATALRLLVALSLSHEPVFESTANSHGTGSTANLTVGPMEVCKSKVCWPRGLSTAL